MRKENEVILILGGLGIAGYLVYSLTKEAKETASGVGKALISSSEGASKVVQAVGDTTQATGSAVSSVVSDVASVVSGASNVSTTITKEGAETIEQSSNIFQSFLSAVQGLINEGKETGGTLINYGQDELKKLLGLDKPSQASITTITPQTSSSSSSSKTLKKPSISANPSAYKIEVKQPDRDSEGKTAWDRRIEANRLKKASGV